MAIQVIPILKALAPVISTAGSMYAEWQRTRSAEPGGRGGDERLDDLDAQLKRLHAASAENSHLIVQLGEQLRETALQLEATHKSLEAERIRLRRLALGAMVLAALALIVAVGALLAG